MDARYILLSLLLLVLTLLTLLGACLIVVNAIIAVVNIFWTLDQSNSIQTLWVKAFIAWIVCECLLTSSLLVIVLHVLPSMAIRFDMDSTRNAINVTIFAYRMFERRRNRHQSSSSSSSSSSLVPSLSSLLLYQRYFISRYIASIHHHHPESKLITFYHSDDFHKRYRHDYDHHHDNDSVDVDSVDNTDIDSRSDVSSSNTTNSTTNDTLTHTPTISSRYNDMKATLFRMIMMFQQVPVVYQDMVLYTLTVLVASSLALLHYHLYVASRPLVVLPTAIILVIISVIR